MYFKKRFQIFIEIICLTTFQSCSKINFFDSQKNLTQSNFTSGNGDFYDVARSLKSQYIASYDINQPISDGSSFFKINTVNQCSFDSDYSEIYAQSDSLFYLENSCGSTATAITKSEIEILDYLPELLSYQGEIF